MSATRITHKELRAKMARGEFRAGRWRDIAPYLDERIGRDEMLSLMRLAVGKPVRPHVEVVLAALEQLFAREHGSLPLVSIYCADVDDTYYKHAAAWLLANALLVEHTEDITALCLEVRRVLV